MADHISEYSTTAANNTSRAGINTGASGSKPVKTVDNMIRAGDAIIAQFYDDIGAVNIVGGTADAITVTSDLAPSAYATGQFFRMIPAASNTSTTVTLNWNGLGVKSVKVADGAGSVSDPAVADIVIGVPAEFRYDGTYFILDNPQTAFGGSGDMVAATYDPTSVEGDAFDMDNMVAGTTNKLFTDTDETKLDGIEAAADVTDTANVTAAGALMDSEVSSLSGIKSLTVPDSTTISSFGATLVDDADAAAARATLGALASIDEDTTPQLGGDLDADGYDITNLTDLQVNGNLVRQSSGGSAILQCDRTDNHGAVAICGHFRVSGRNDASASVVAGEMSVVCTDAGAATFDGSYRFATTQAGALQNRFQIDDGVKAGTPTGGDKGFGTLNASAVYDDNTLLTCMALQREFMANKTIDLKKWDAQVPDIEVPEERHEEPIYVDYTLEHPVKTLKRNRRGQLIQHVETQTVTRRVQLVHAEPVYDDDDNIVDAVEEKMFETKITPSRIIKRTHHTAHMFKAMVDDGFDPRKPEQYFARMQNDEALPGMPTKADWQHNSMSVGEIGSRKWLAMEMMAIVMHSMWIKINDHESRIAALEAAQ